tara:strand:- start:148 stop:444 length:297 start_codon:yes stop_codon:yes gene_type:complete
MHEIKFNVESSGEYRPTEIMSDLRIVAETMFIPMKMVGFWDYQQDIHLCPHLEKRKDCPHTLDENDNNYESYEKTLQKERNAILSIDFPHAQIKLFMS